MSGIGTLNEGSLHAALKLLYSEPGDEFEVPLDRFVIDIKRGDQLIEVQTGAFGPLGAKFDHLLPDYKVLLVHPIATQTYLARPGKSPRRSPKRGSIYTLFEQLVSLPTLLDHPNFSIEIVLATVTKQQIDDPKARRGRGGFRTVDRTLEAVHERRRFDSPGDLTSLLPDELPERFTTADLSEACGVSRDIARQMAYCFRLLGTFTQLDRTRAGIHYSLG